jgi:spermidine synthase
MARPTTDACLTLGASLALLVSALPDAVLLPAVDRWPPRHLGLALTGALVSAGWLAATWGSRRTIARRALWMLLVAALGGGFLSAALAAAWRESLAAALREPGSAYYPRIALACLTTAAPLALPLGALSGVALGAGSPRARRALLLGAALGLALAPPLIEILLAGTRTLHLVGLLGACAGVLLLEEQPLVLEPRRVSLRAAVALAAAAGAGLVACRQLELGLDRSALVAPLFAALAGLGAALAPSTWPRGAVGWLAAAIAALALCTPAAPFVLPTSGASTAGLALTAGVALVFGALLGATLADGDGRTVPVALVPALLVLLLPLVSVLLLPRLGPRPALLVLGAAAALPLLPRARSHEIPLVALLTLGTLALLGVGPRLPAGALAVVDSLRLDDGLLACVEDPATGRTLVALDGHAPLGVSAGQTRRFAHLPLLLHEAPRSVLVVAADSGETARAATWHAPSTLHWLQPLPIPAAWLEHPWPGDQPPTSGSERQFLSVERGPYDAIVMAPDLRAGRRAGLVGTVEFYELARRRLAPGGLLCQWWDLAETDVTDLKTVLAAGQQVFPWVYVALDQPRTRRAALAMLYSDRPLSVSPAHIDARLAAHPDLARDFEEVGLDGLAIACLVTADRSLVELLAPREEALHDDRPALGVRGALRAGGPDERLLVGLRTFAQWRRDPLDWIDVPPPEQPPVAAIVRDRFRSWQHLFGGAQHVVAARGAAAIPFDRETPIETPPEEADALLDALVGLPDWDYLRDRVLGYADRLERGGDRAAAEHYLRTAVAKDEGSAAIRFALASVVERKGDRADALVLYRTVLAFEPQHAGALARVEALEAR